jgi:hypothetical protein
MATTVDHLSSDKAIKVLQDFTDAAGNRFYAGEKAEIRTIDLDWKTFMCTIRLEQGGLFRDMVLYPPTANAEGLRPGRMKEFLEVVGDAYKPLPPQPEPQWVEAPEAEPEQEPESSSDWYRDVELLERQDRLEEAEQLIEKRINNLYSAICIAEMYKKRWHRLKKQGRQEEAEAARQKSADWAWNLAAGATSGGEGVALSRERDEFLKTLGLEPPKPIHRGRPLPP